MRTILTIGAKNHVAFMLDNHLMAGDGDTGMFRPKDPVTREEAAIIAYRCYILYGKNYEGQIKTTLRSTSDANGKQIQTLIKTIVLPNGATGGTALCVKSRCGNR